MKLPIVGIRSCWRSAQIGAMMFDSSEYLDQGLLPVRAG